MHGKIDPLNNIGPDEIYIKQLVNRVQNGNVSEVVISTNPTMEGEATAMYIAKQLKISIDKKSDLFMKDLIISRIGRGLPTGADIEYADEITLQRAMDGRSKY